MLTSLKGQLKQEVKHLFEQTPLKPFTEKWTKKLHDYQANVEITADLKDEKVIEDFNEYKKLNELLLDKGKLILAGIEDIHKTQTNAVEIDRLALKENNFKIVGPITRDFAKVYLELLTEFSKQNYSTLETLGVSLYARISGFQSISQREKDTINKIKCVNEKIHQYDLEHPSQQGVKFKP